jgi:hypothetical protein
VSSNASEEDKLKAMMSQAGEDWQPNQLVNVLLLLIINRIKIVDSVVRCHRYSYVGVESVCCSLPRFRATSL